MFTDAVAMFCGPHDEGDQTPVRRIDQAINIALEQGFPLFIAGDAFEGAEVRRFQVRAWHAGVSSAIQAFDPRHCTLSDAQAVAIQILEMQMIRLCRIHLVTDWWHMDRASVMLDGEIKKIVDRNIQIVPKPILTGPTPCDLVRCNERTGLADYRAGRYGQRQVIDPLRHRHIQPRY